jgi:8-oxo-dGTP pyrophosphatase MutT (NUDIX family)
MADSNSPDQIDAGAGTGSPVRRKVARVLLLDETGAVLLLSGRDPDKPSASAQQFWFTPGGGAEAGESLEDAGRREVHEETGHVVGDLGPVRWRRETSFSFGGYAFEQDESYFVVRTQRFEVHPVAWTELERRSTTGWRWWPLEELCATDAVVYPAGLACLLAAVEADEPFPRPDSGSRS